MGKSVFAQGFVDYFSRPLYKYDEMQTTGSDTVAAPLLTKESPECGACSCVDSDLVVIYTDCSEQSKHTPPETLVGSP